jgi:hypothetical protein
MNRRTFAALFSLLAAATYAQGGAALFVEEPFGSFGWFNPTGHAAVYLSHVCADSPVHLRPCRDGENGVVLSRYHRVGGYDWIAIPLIPYLYAVESLEQIPAPADEKTVAALRDSYRRAHLSEIVPDGAGGSVPDGDWIQLAGSSYDRTIYSYEIETSAAQDEKLIQALNARANTSHFNLLFHNCADFSRAVLDFYYPHAVHRGILNDLGIMTPKQAARTLAKYSRKHKDLEFTAMEIPQIPGLPRSRAVRGVMESFVKSKKYVAPVAVLHPLVIEAHPPRVTESALTPTQVAAELGGGAPPRPPAVNLR